MLRARDLGRAKRALCEPLAERLGLDYNLESLAILDGVEGPAPRTAPEQLAFALVLPGASLILNLAEPDGYPGVSPKAARRGSRAVRRCIGRSTGSAASVFMAHALCEHMACVQESYGESGSANAYRRCRVLLGKSYPLTEQWENSLLAGTSELVHLLNGTAPEVPVNGFHVEAHRGGDPRKDPELLEVERQHVGAYFRRSATFTAIELCVGPSAFARSRETLLTFGHLGREALIYAAGELAAWSTVTEQWSPAVEHALSASER